MDELDIYEELQKINSIHHSLDEKNVMTYCILRESNRARFSDAQIKWINNRIDLLHDKQRKITEDGLANVDIELASKPLLEKYTDIGEFLQIG